MRRPLIDEHRRRYGLASTVHTLQRVQNEILLSERTGDVTINNIHGGAVGSGGSGSGEPTADAHIADTADAHDASAISILDTAGDFTATDVEGALAELQSDNEAHVAAADPHTGYVREIDANWVDLTDGGASTLHSHAGGGGLSLGLAYALAAGTALP